MTPKAEKVALTKKRTRNNLFLVLVLIPIMVAVFRYYNDAASLLTGIPREQIGDLGIEILQPIPVAMIYTAMAAVFATLLAAFIEPQLKENAFNQWSRFGILFICSFLGFCSIAAAIL